MTNKSTQVRFIPFRNDRLRRESREEDSLDDKFWIPCFLWEKLFHGRGFLFPSMDITETAFSHPWQPQSPVVYRVAPFLLVACPFAFQNGIKQSWKMMTPYHTPWQSKK